MFNKYSFLTTLLILSLPRTGFTVTIATENFSSDDRSPLNKSDTGKGWNEPWYAGPGFTVTSPNLSHPAVTQITGNKATLVGFTSTATRSLDGFAVTQVANTLTTPEGLWYRVLLSNQKQGADPISDIAFQLQLGNGVAVVNTILATNFNQSHSEAALYINESYKTIDSLKPSDTYLSIVNLKNVGQNSEDFPVFKADLWILDDSQNSFNPASSPNATVTKSLGMYMPNSLTVQLSSYKSGKTDISGIYFGESPVDLGLNIDPAPEPATIISILMGAGYWFKRRRAK